MKDLKNNIDLGVSINPAVYNSNQEGAGVDLRGYDSAMAVIQSGADTDGDHTPKIQESDDNATFTDVAAADLEGSLSALSENSVQRIGYKGSKRYINVYVTSTGSTGMVYGAMIVRGHPNQAPLS